MDNKKILVIDDDVNLCQSINIAFSRQGASVYTAANGRIGLKQFYHYQPDLVILDISMPVMNGWETCQQLRMLSDVPILILTSLTREQDIIRGLQHGADDFVTKPFSRDVLVARVNAILRRTKGQANAFVAAGGENLPAYDDGYLQIDLERRQIRVAGDQVKLTSTEFRILSYLYQNAGTVLTYQNILTHVWGWEYRNDINYVQVYLSYLRRKLEQDSRNPRYLLNEHGVGYRFLRQDLN